MPGHLNADQIAGQAVAFADNEIGNDQDKKRPADDLHRPAGNRTDQVAGPAEQWLDKGKDILDESALCQGRHIDRERADLVHLARDLLDHGRQAGDNGLHLVNKILNLLDQPNPPNREKTHDRYQNGQVQDADCRLPGDIETVRDQRRQRVEQIGDDEDEQKRRDQNSGSER